MQRVRMGECQSGKSDTETRRRWVISQKINTLCVGFCVLNLDAESRLTTERRVADSGKESVVGYPPFRSWTPLRDSPDRIRRFRCPAFVLCGGGLFGEMVDYLSETGVRNKKSTTSDRYYLRAWWSCIYLCSVVFFMEIRLWLSKKGVS